MLLQNVTESLGIKGKITIYIRVQVINLKTTKKKKFYFTLPTIE